MRTRSDPSACSAARLRSSIAMPSAVSPTQRVRGALERARPLGFLRELVLVAEGE